MNLFRWDVASVVCWFFFFPSAVLLKDRKADEIRRAERARPRKRERKSTDRVRGVIEHNRNTGPHSAGGTLARTKPPILWWQAANGGPLPYWMLMQNFGPQGLALFPNHKERRPGRVHAWQAQFTPTSAKDNNRINHKRLLDSFFLTPLPLSIRVWTASNTCCS